MASPYLPCSQARPPPSVKPAIPVLETMPLGVASPKTAVARSSSPTVTPGCARTVRRAGST